MKEIKLCYLHRKESNADDIYEELRIPREHFNLVIDNEDPDYIIASEWIYYKKEIYDKFISLQDKKRVNIFVAGECIYPDLNIFDYVIGYTKFPQVADRIGFIHPIDFFDRRLINKEKLFNKTNIKNEKKRFCNFMYTNANAHPMRDYLFYEISKYRKVDSLGTHLRNVQLEDSFVDASIRENYKFTIAAENAIFEGYFTEKIYGAYQANTIPIYWGERHIENYCNPKSFINANNLSINELLEKIKYLDNNEDAYNEMLSEPFMTDSQYQEYLKNQKTYSVFIKNLFEQPIALAKRIPEGFHPNNYRHFFSGLAFKGAFDTEITKKETSNIKDKIFSVKNEYKNNRKYKVLTFLGVKIKKRCISKIDKINKAKYKRELTLKEKRFYLEKHFEANLGYKLNLDNPRTFNEKIQWLKFNYRDPLMTKCADKVGVRDYIKEKIGEEYLVPIIGIYDSVDEIDFESLPNQFVAKVNWGSGQNIIVTDKSKLDIEETKKKLSNWMKPESNHYYMGLEWCYKDIEPKIIIEKFLEQLNGDLYDYKYYCFDNKVEFMLIVSDRFNNKYCDFYDSKYNKLPFCWTSHPSPKGVEQPKNFEKMIHLSEILSEKFPFVRVDFYDTGKELYVGELTFYPGNGTDKFDPIEWDYKLGELINIAEIKKTL